MAARGSCDYKVFEFRLEEIVWAKQGAFPWWPAAVYEHHEGKGLVEVRFFDNKGSQYCLLPPERLKHFTNGRKEQSELNEQQQSKQSSKRRVFDPEELEAAISEAQKALKEKKRKREIEPHREELRAGYKICYWDPIHRSQMILITASILEIYPPARLSHGESPLRTDKMHPLATDTPIRRVDPKPTDSRMRNLSDYDLIPSRVDGKDFMQQVGAAREAMERITAEANPRFARALVGEESAAGIGRGRAGKKQKERNGGTQSGDRSSDDFQVARAGKRAIIGRKGTARVLVSESGEDFDEDLGVGPEKASDKSADAATPPARGSRGRVRSPKRDEAQGGKSNQGSSDVEILRTPKTLKRPSVAQASRDKGKKGKKGKKEGRKRSRESAADDDTDSLDDSFIASFVPKSARSLSKTHADLGSPSSPSKRADQEDEDGLAAGSKQRSGRLKHRRKRQTPPRNGSSRPPRRQLRPSSP